MPASFVVKKGSKIRSRADSDTPGPSSSTAIAIPSPARSSEIVTRARGTPACASMALLTRFQITWRVASASIEGRAAAARSSRS